MKIRQRELSPPAYMASLIQARCLGSGCAPRGIDVVIKACVALHTDELRKEEGSREYWRAKAAEGSTIELQQTPLSTERVRRALLLLPLFPRFVYVLRVLEGYSLSYVASILNVDNDACQAALAYSFGAFAEALMPVQLANQQ